ncbi:hypothetical protein [Streptomyces sp. NPDC005231]|uniref:hypothetical protein n=1 Tax=Streptomyces sp. NPDC005231 TaxID=3157026 RepID=UPI0033AA577A
MAYIIILAKGDEKELHGKLTIRQSFTWNIPGRSRRNFDEIGPNLTLIFVADDGQKLPIGNKGDMEKVSLAWVGAILSGIHQKSTSLDYRARIKLVRKVSRPVSLADLARVLRKHEERALQVAAMEPSGIYPLAKDMARATLGAVRYLRPEMNELLDFLEVAVNSDSLDSVSPEDQFWREERDAMRTVLRIGQFSTALAGVWRRPTDGNAPYLAGLIRDPTEAALMEHDTRFFDGWAGGKYPQGRCDIQVFTDGARRLEIANVNATPIEGRLGTDLIYYHHGTHSFTLVQYKKLGQGGRPMYVGPNDRLHAQIDRLEAVNMKSRVPDAARDWRLSSDHCFIKLAHWTEEDSAGDAAPTNGLILPVTYIRLLLRDSATATRGEGRNLGYEQVERYLTNSQFIELVQDGFIGSVGVDVETLRNIVDERVEQGQGTLVAIEASDETPSERRRRNHSRSA